MKKKFKNKEVEQIFKAYPKVMREKLLLLREFIFEVAASNEIIGELEETLKWGEPSFLTSFSKSGSMIRMNALKNGNQYALYFLCQTNLIRIFKDLFPTQFRYEGNRAIIFELDEKIHIKELKQIIEIALTYKKLPPDW